MPSTTTANPEQLNVKRALDLLFNKNEIAEDALCTMSNSFNAFAETTSALSTSFAKMEKDLGDKVSQDLLGQPNGVAELDENGVLVASQRPSGSTGSEYPHYAHGSKLYVSKQGSDEMGDGRELNPWLTVQHAINVIQNSTGNGEVTLNIGEGTFNENIIINCSRALIINGAGRGVTILRGTTANGITLNIPSGTITLNNITININGSGTGVEVKVGRLLMNSYIEINGNNKQGIGLAVRYAAEAFTATSSGSRALINNCNNAIAAEASLCIFHYLGGSGNNVAFSCTYSALIIYNASQAPAATTVLSRGGNGSAIVNNAFVS